MGEVSAEELQEVRGYLQLECGIHATGVRRLKIDRLVLWFGPPWWLAWVEVAKCFLDHNHHDGQFEEDCQEQEARVVFVIEAKP